MASTQQRLVEHAGGVWDLLWPVDEVGPGRPPATRKYQLVDGPPTVVSNRPAQVIEVREGATLLERLALDRDTGLLLRREQFEDGQGPYRTVEFVSVSIGGPTPAPDAPQNVVNASPKAMAASHLPSGMTAPAGLGDGYQRTGLYQRSGVVQVLYSDGLYDLSVFQQPGRLDGQHLPVGTSVAIGPAIGRHYTWPGGHVVVWQRSGTVFTAVSDAPLSQVLAAVRSLPQPSRSTSLLHRLRQACRDLVEPLAS
jgi:hypothetical protein